MRPERPLNPILLVTLLCPQCHRRVAVMDHFPTGKEKRTEITLIDGQTPERGDRLFCRRCFISFPTTKAHFPEHVFLKPVDEPPARTEPPKRSSPLIIP